MQAGKLSALSGLAFVALVLVAIIGLSGSTPGTDASAEKLASFYADNDVRQFVTSFVLATAAPFLVVFGVGLVDTWGRAGSGPVTTWGFVLLAGTILAAGAVLLTAFVHLALSDAAEVGDTPTALQALNSLDGNTWMVFNPAFGIMLLGVAGTRLSAGVRRWHVWIPLALGVALFIPFADFFALLATLLWIVVTSIVLARGGSRVAYVAAPGTA
jgi:hypothetical protein